MTNSPLMLDLLKSWHDIGFNTLRLIDNKKIAKDAYVIKFRRNFNFKAGQVVALGINLEIQPRIYSIASGEDDEFVEVIYTEKTNGQLTPLLSLLRSGDVIMVSQPFGAFVEIPDSPIWIASGTGVAPFIAMLKSGKGTDATLIHSVKDSQYFYYNDFLREKLGDRYIRCCSSCNAEDVFGVKVTQYLGSIALNPDKKYYLCGAVDIVLDVRDFLISKGIPFRNVITEIYF